MAAVNVTFPGNLAQVETAQDLRSIPSALIASGDLYLVNGLQGLFEYDTGSVSVDDGTDVIRPYDKTPLQAGRWIRNVDGLASGPQGETGPANSTYPNLSSLQAAATSNRSYILASPSGSDSGVVNGLFNYQLGNFTGRTDVVFLDSDPTGAKGALVRQKADGISTQQVAVTGGKVRPQVSKNNDIVSVLDFPNVDPTGATNSTSGVQAAWNAVKAGGRDILWPGGRYTVDTSGLNFSFDGGNLNSKFRFVGEGPRNTVIVPTGTGGARPFLNFSASSMPTAPTDANLYVGHLSIDGGDKANGNVGIRMTGIAHFNVENVVIENCATGVDILGSLVGTIEKSTISRNSVGIQARKSANIYNNAITVRDCRMNLNTQFAVDFDQGSLLRLRDCDVEANGTSGNTDTGAIIIRNGVDDEFGYAMVEIDGTWLEGNFGRGIQVQDASLILSLRNVQIIAQQAGACLYVANALSVTLDDCMMPSPGDTAFINCGSLRQLGGIISAVTGTQQQKLRGGYNDAGSPTGYFRDDVSIGEQKALRMSGPGGGFGQFLYNASDAILDLSMATGTGKRLRFIDGSFDAAALKVNNQQVVGPRQAAIANSGDATVNAILAALRAHGLIAT